MEEEKEFIPVEDAAPSFTRTVENPNADPNKPGRSWEAIRDDCASGGNLDDRCNLVAAGEGQVKLDIVLYKLSCGCYLVPVDAEEIEL